MSDGLLTVCDLKIKRRSFHLEDFFLNPNSLPCESKVIKEIQAWFVLDDASVILQHFCEVQISHGCLAPQLLVIPSEGVYGPRLIS